MAFDGITQPVLGRATPLASVTHPRSSSKQRLLARFVGPAGRGSDHDSHHTNTFHNATSATNQAQTRKNGAERARI
jgi:hypothetical protein